jgi:hypothetical protein
MARVKVLDHLLALLAEKDLRDQQRFDGQQQALTAALLAADTAVRAAQAAAEKAVAKAEAATEKRFESVNEFRKTLSDQTASFPSRVELQALADRVADLATRLDKAEGRNRGVSASVATMLAVGGLLLGLLGVVVAVLLKA